MAKSVIDGVNCCQFIENEQKLVVEILMDAQGTDDKFLFNLVEPGRTNQCNFLHPKQLTTKVEAFLDSIFNHLLQSYGAAYCKKLLGGGWACKKGGASPNNTKDN